MYKFFVLVIFSLALAACGGGGGNDDSSGDVVDVGNGSQDDGATEGGNEDDDATENGNEDDGATEGGNEDEGSPNTAPTISVSEISIEEKLPVTISPTITDDGEISHYEWIQLRGPSAALDSTDDAELTFVAPEVKQDETMTFQITVIDDMGAESIAEVDVFVQQKTLALTLSGLVTDAPIVNPKLTIFVGEQEFTVEGDSDGAYIVELILDDTQAEDFVRIIAQGVGNQQNAKLQSLLGTVTKLSDLAGEDKILDKDELFSVNVTNLSTARSVLILEKNNGQFVATDAELDLLNKGIDPLKLINFAVAIKIVIDKSADESAFSLPIDIEDTLALISNKDAITEYLEKVKNDAVFSSTTSEMLSDENIILPFQPAPIYYIDNSKEMGVLELSEDHSGSFLSSADRLELTWFISNGKLVTRYNNKGILLWEGEEQRDVNGLSEFKSFGVYITEKHYHLIQESEESTVFNIVSKAEKIFTDNTIDSKDIETTNTPIQGNTVTAYTSAQTLPFDLPNETPFTIALPSLGSINSIVNQVSENNAINREYYGTKFQMNENGTGVALGIDENFQWQIIDVNGNEELHISLDSGVNTKYVRINQQRYAAVIEKDNIRVSQVENGALVDSQLAFDADAISGIYLNTTDKKSDTTNFAWQELWPTGEVYDITTIDQDNNGKIEDSEIYINFGHWTVSAHGRLNIQLYKYVGNPFLTGCFDAQHGCYLSREIDHTMIAEDIDTASFLTHSEWKIDIPPDGDHYWNVVVNNSFTRIDKRPIELPAIAGISSEPLEDRPVDIPVPTLDEHSLLGEVIYQDLTILECLENTPNEQTGENYNDTLLVSSVTNFSCDNNILESLEDLAQFSSLKKVEFSGLSNVDWQEIASLPTSINHFSFSNKTEEDGDISEISFSDLTIFSDREGLDTLILDDINISDWTPLDAISVENLTIKNQASFDSLEGINFGNVGFLSLINLPLTDISALATQTDLQGLSILNLDSRAYTDISWLSAYDKLEAFHIDQAIFDDLNLLANSYSTLVSLGLANANILDWQPLAMMPNIASLGVSNTSFADLSLLNNNQSDFRKLDIQYTEVYQLDNLLDGPFSAMSEGTDLEVIINPEMSGRFSLQIIEDLRMLNTLVEGYEVVNASISPPYGTLYLRGQDNSWEAEEPMLYSSGVYTSFSNLTNLCGDFLIASEDYTTTFSKKSRTPIDSNTPTPLIASTTDCCLSTNIDENGEYRFDFNTLATTLTIKPSNILAATPIYLRGSMNGWAVDNELSYIGGSRYQTTAQVTEGSYAFKIAAEDYSIEFGAVTIGEVIETGLKQQLAPIGNAGDVSINLDDGNYLFTFDLIDESLPAVTIVREHPLEGAPLYIHGINGNEDALHELIYQGNARYSADISMSIGDWTFTIADETSTLESTLGSGEQTMVEPGVSVSDFGQSSEPFSIRAEALLVYRFTLDYSRGYPVLTIESFNPA